MNANQTDNIRQPVEEGVEAIRRDCNRIGKKAIDDLGARHDNVEQQG